MMLNTEGGAVMMKATDSWRRAPVRLCLTAASMLLVAGCAADGSTGSVGVGTGAGALGGAALANVLGGGTAAMLGGAAVGGIAGNMMVDRPADVTRQQEAEAARDRDVQRQLEFERQSIIQEEQVRRDLEQQRLFEQWQREQ
ncbi:MAG: hypothetical protein OET79_12600, partial [Nitrospirota bacterium]|nr:hypothetical protein [Nitrospirota bacterium]